MESLKDIVTSDKVDEAAFEDLVAMEAAIVKRKAELKKVEALALAQKFEEMAEPLGMSARAVVALLRKPRKKKDRKEEYEIETEVEGDA